jgi:o-succinylbenzoate---CoA ligase
MALFRARAVACLVDPRMDPDAVRRRLKGIDCSRVIAMDGALESSGLTVLKSDDLISSFSETPEADAGTRLALDQPATITWPDERAILHTYGNHYYGARGFNHYVRASSGSRWLLLEPLHRSNGLELLFQCAASGATLIMPDVKENAQGAIDRYGVTHMLLPSTRLEEMLNDGFSRKKHPAIHSIVLNEPVPEELLRRSYELGLPVHRSYGVPEAASALAVAPLDSPPAKRSTSGKVIRYCKVRIAADGEIMLKGQTLFSGYVDGADVRSAVDADGWFATGSVGTLDTEEYLTVLGKK